MANGWGFSLVHPAPLPGRPISVEDETDDLHDLRAGAVRKWLTFGCVRIFETKREPGHRRTLYVGTFSFVAIIMGQRLADRFIPPGLAPVVYAAFWFPSTGGVGALGSDCVNTFFLNPGILVLSASRSV